MCVMKHVMVMIVTVPVCVVTDIWYHSLPGYQGRESEYYDKQQHRHITVSRFPHLGELIHSTGSCNTNIALSETPSVPLSSPQFPGCFLLQHQMILICVHVPCPCRTLIANGTFNFVSFSIVILLTVGDCENPRWAMRCWRQQTRLHRSDKIDWVGIFLISHLHIYVRPVQYCSLSTQYPVLTSFTFAIIIQ